jgi:hypothetical protein
MSEASEPIADNDRAWQQRRMQTFGIINAKFLVT